MPSMFTPGRAVLEDKRRLRLSQLRDDSRILAIVLPALEDETIDPLRLHFAHERSQARFAGDELGDAMPPVTDHDERSHRELGDRGEEDPLLRIDFVVEVKATTARGKAAMAARVAVR